MGKRTGHIHLSVSIQGAGYHPGSWRHPVSGAGRLHTPDTLYSLAQTAEQGLFDLLIADHTFVGERLRASGQEPGLLLEPLTLLGGLASVTRRIGLGAAVSTTALEPFALARQLAVLDHLSGGRTAWLPSTGDHGEPTRSHDDNPDWTPEQRAERQQEFTDVAARLWESWEEGAVIADRERGLYIDSDKVHVIGHIGKYFKVRGPLSIPRPPQGHPVRIGLSAGADPEAELILSSPYSLEEAASQYAALKRNAARQGRFPNERKVLTSLSPILAETEEEARHKAAELRELTDPYAGIALLSDRLGIDLTKYPQDGPPPPVPALTEAAQAAGLEGLSLRELSSRTLELTGTQVFIGTPEQLADWMEAWYSEYGSDGFHLRPALLPDGLEAVAREVVPLLQRRGLFRTAYTGTTLRDHLGLPDLSGGRRSTGGVQA